MRVLMLVAHPDDETLFGFHDLYYNDTTVICFTNESNTIRKNNFTMVTRALYRKHYMLSFPDSEHNAWLTFTDTDIISKYIIPVLNKNRAYDVIVTHDIHGEYGHIQHTRVNSIGSALAEHLQIPCITFNMRYSILDEYDTGYVKTREKMLNIYSTEKGPITNLKHFQLQSSIIKASVFLCIAFFSLLYINRKT